MTTFCTPNIIEIGLYRSTITKGKTSSLMTNNIIQ